jgi:ribulose-5-phosphate 4-epimerase/fuculose-1-phosphate aldolase
MKGRIALLVILVCTLAAGTCSAGPATPRLQPSALSDLVAANHILVDQEVIDVRGHVSVRDPADPYRFWISRAMAPGLVAQTDMQAFDLEGHQLGGAKGEAYTERFIHARIYQARPDVMAIVHAHTRSLVTLSVSGVPVRPVTTAALFAVAGVPVHVNGRYGAGIHDIESGDALARTLGASNAALMQGHGMVVVGGSIPSAVGRSIGLDANARMLIDLMAMHVEPVYLAPPPQVAAQSGDYAREWGWWNRRIKRSHTTAINSGDTP